MKKRNSLIEVFEPSDARAVRNKETILSFYKSIDEKRTEEITAISVRTGSGYVQHNPLIANGGDALGQFFAKITADHERARVVVHRIIAVGDWVWAHVNFFNLVNDDPDDTGLAGVDIWLMDAEGKAIEHWDALQVVGTPDNSAPWVGPNIRRANDNEMF
jgi:predicted SnoaL-like aldol condensation-catalyzing enzyme